MKNASLARSRNVPESSLLRLLSEKIVGQDSAIEIIVPYIQMYQAGLAPEGHPAGIFFLLGPTGTGKTRTVEALAEVLHGSARNLVRVDCGEFQMDHEVAKLIGAPPGYLGHRETQPILTQARLNASASDKCNLSIVLFDEVEKAAPSLNRLLLGVLDKAMLRLGDASVVNFERSLIFLTSNLGARGMAGVLKPRFGLLGRAPAADRPERKLDRIAQAAARRHFSPEFMNRIDALITYRPLEPAAIEAILDQQVADIQRLIDARLGSRRFRIEVTGGARRFLIERGASAEYGARELKRILHRHAIQPLAALVADGLIEPGCHARIELTEDGDGLCWLTTRPKRPPEASANAA